MNETSANGAAGVDIVSVESDGVACCRISSCVDNGLEESDNAVVRGDGIASF